MKRVWYDLLVDLCRNAFGMIFRWIYVETRLVRFFGGIMKRVWYDFSVDL